MSPHFVTRCVFRLLGLAQVSWATACVGVHCPSPFLLFPPMSLVHSLSTCRWSPLVFLLYDPRTFVHLSAPIRATPSLPGLELALVPEVVFSEAEHGVRNAHDAEISFQISALAGVC